MTYRQQTIARADGQVGVLVYDEEDAALIEAHSWYLAIDSGGRKYAVTTVTERGHKRSLRAGQLIMGWGPWGYGRVEYLNGNSLDCRRQNLRHANQSQVLAKRTPVGGSSQYKGVTWDKERSKWLVTFRGRKIGRFVDEVAAARAFDEAAFSYWGDQAYLNFPDPIRPE